VNVFEFSRRNKRIPLYALAKQVRISEYFLGLLEKGAAIPSQAQASRIGEVLGIPDATPEKLREEVIPTVSYEKVGA
jgi:ribosome-binding protein aMBF1 (putative translation factor)